MLRRVRRMRRLRAEWMTRTDDEILEYIEENGAGTPKSIADALSRNNDYIGRRCRKLAESGLLSRPSTGFYTITEEGESYLSGDLDADDLADPYS
jgi:predicted transcriptional regulator